MHTSKYRNLIMSNANTIGNRICLFQFLLWIFFSQTRKKITCQYIRKKEFLLHNAISQTCLSQGKKEKTKSCS